MALDKDRLGAAFTAAVASENIQAGTPITNGNLLSIWTKIAEADINEFTGHGVIVPTALMAPNGPVTGTGEIT